MFHWLPPRTPTKKKCLLSIRQFLVGVARMTGLRLHTELLDIAAPTNTSAGKGMGSVLVKLFDEPSNFFV